MSSRLEIFPNPDSAHSRELKLGPVATIGRSPESSVAIPDNPQVALFHAEIRTGGKTGYLLADLGTLNGTFLNGERIDEEASLRDGDEIRVGNTRILFHAAPSSDPAEPSIAEAPAQEEARTAQRIRNTEKLFRLLSDNVTDLMAIIDENGRRIWTNEAYNKILGYDTSELRGTYSMGDLHPDDLDKVRKVFAESMKTGVGQPLEYRMLHRDGSSVHLESKATIVDNWDGHRRCMVVVARDVTQRKRAEAELEKSRARLAAEIAEAAEYVRSLLPDPIKGEVATEWRYLPSSQLGGDCFGYHWIDDDRLAVYLLDVVNHGVGPALLSVSVLNMLRSQSLPGGDFTDPGDILTCLNRTFQMQDQNEMYFTIWYGVYDRPKRELRYASAGHPPALLFSDHDDAKTGCHELRGRGMIIGALPDAAYETHRHSLGGTHHLYVFSDGIYEMNPPDGKEWALPEFAELLRGMSHGGPPDLDRVLDKIRSIQGADEFEDDCSLLRLEISCP